jgi:hypothetical protein
MVENVRRSPILSITFWKSCYNISLRIPTQETRPT